VWRKGTGSDLSDLQRKSSVVSGVSAVTGKESQGQVRSGDDAVKQAVSGATRGWQCLNRRLRRGGRRRRRTSEFQHPDDVNCKILWFLGF
jgi:hypothetical protein